MPHASAGVSAPGAVDVLVVGAGLAGLQCARGLAEKGVRVLLVDRKPAVDHAVHTTGIFVRRTLESFALPEACLGPPVRLLRSRNASRVRAGTAARRAATARGCAR